MNIRYRWTKNCENFDYKLHADRMTQQIAQGTIIITNPSKEDSGQYQCFAENNRGIATSNSVFVRIVKLNDIKTNVRTVTTIEGAPLLLECQLPIGSLKSRIFWTKLKKSVENIDLPFKDSLILGNSSDARLILDRWYNLYFFNVTHDDASDGFDYACITLSVLTGQPHILSRVNLEVLKQSEISKNEIANQHFQYLSSENVVIELGEEAVLFCVFKEKLKNPEVKWQKDGNPINGNEYIIILNFGQLLKIKNVINDDAGTYTCESNEGHKHLMNLVVNVPPYFLLRPKDQSVVPGEKVEIKCIASGAPSVNLKWSFNGILIEKVPLNPRRTLTANSIIIENVTSNDAGNYGCNASNSIKYRYSESKISVLNIPPEFTEIPRQVVTIEYKHITLRCRVFGIPTPTIKWLRNGKEITNDHFTKQENGDLFLFFAQQEDAGEFTCYAHNKWGSIEATASLIVKKETSVTITPREIQLYLGQAVTIKCNVSSDPTLNVNVEWTQDSFRPEESDFKTHPRFKIGSDYSLTISNMTEKDFEIYGCKAKTEIDESYDKIYLEEIEAYGPTFKFFILDCKKVDKVSLEWKHPTSELFTIKYRTPYDSQWTVLKNKTGSRATVDVIPNTDYNFFITTGDGLGANEEKSCKTQSDIPHKNPINVHTERTMPKNLKIAWDPIPKKERNAEGFYYIVYWKQDDSNMDWNVNYTKNSEQCTLDIPNQPIYTRYRIKVKSANDMGELPTDATEIFGYSGEYYPEQAPTNLTLINVIGQSANLSWNRVPLKTLNGDFKGYKIQIWNDIDGKVNMSETLIKKDVTNYLVDGLRPGTINYAQVLVLNNDYSSPPSESVQIKVTEEFQVLPDPVTTTAIILTIVISSLTVVSSLVCYYRRYRRLKKEGFSTKDFEEGRPESIDPDLPLDEQAHLLPYDSRFEFPRNKLDLGKQLGSGAFGIVVKAQATGILNHEDETIVAVKMVKKIEDNEVL